MNPRSGHTRFPRPAILAVVMVLWLVGNGLAAVLADAGEPPGHADEAILNCARCHTCAKPTPENICMPTCTRVEAGALEMSRKRGPEGVILLDMLSGEKQVVDRFGPVAFDHGGHAGWAEIAGGCTLCHHYTPEGTGHPACRTCHSIELRHERIQVPSLKGAYHRQCLGCHREWTHTTECDACHVERVGEAELDLTPEQLLQHMIEGHKVAPIPEPEVEVYETNYPPGDGTRVYFHHTRHAKVYGFKCAVCHRGDNCARCHRGTGEPTLRVRVQPATVTKAHQPCELCHDRQTKGTRAGTCDYCHLKEGTPPPGPFDHASTGWPLARYHTKAACRSCHRTMPIHKLDRQCASCHGKWDSKSFDHGKATRLALDAMHAAMGCAMCHREDRFDQPPSCTGCHDENFVYPQKKPGSIVPAQQGPGRPVTPIGGQTGLPTAPR